MTTSRFLNDGQHDLESRAAEAVERLLGDRVVACHRLDRGFTNANVQVRLESGAEALVKFPQWPRPEKQRHVTAMLEHLRQHGIPAPTVLAEDVAAQVSREPVVILSFIPGDTLSDVYSGLSASERERIGVRLGELLARMHAVEVSGRHQGELALAELRRRVQRAKETRLIPDEQVEIAAALVEGVARMRMGEPARVIHGDIYPDNIIVARPPGERELIGLIDFDHVDHDDPVRDFVKLRWWVFEPLPDLVDPVLSGYLRAGGDPDAASPVSHRFMAASLLETMAGIPYFMARNTSHDDQMAADFRRRFERLIGVVGESPE